VCFDSRAEANFALWLDSELRKHKIEGWRRQEWVKLSVNDKKIAQYVVDFVVTHLDGHEEWIEMKGKWTAEARLKVALFRALFPNRLYRVVSSKGWS